MSAFYCKTARGDVRLEDMLVEELRALVKNEVDGMGEGALVLVTIFNLLAREVACQLVRRALADEHKDFPP